ncbi:MAG: hypothetical protein AABY32_01845 [Nanoarchaeota archaeon]
MFNCSFPVWSKDSAIMVRVVNMGIDSYLEAITESEFKWDTKDRGLRLYCKISDKDIFIVLRRLNELFENEDDEDAFCLAEDIRQVIEEENKEKAGV